MTSGMIDPNQGTFIFATGKKRQGKSHLVRGLFDTFPYDKLVLDVTGDVRKDFLSEGIEFVELHDPLPVRFPKPLREGDRSTTALYVPDMGSATAIDDLDRALGLALAGRRRAVWIDEIGAMSAPNRTPPNLRRALHHGRHRQLTLMMCGPRPVNVDPLVLGQSDHVFVFQLPNPRDRDRVAETIGWPPGEFDAAAHALRTHEYLWYDDAADDGQGELRHMPPLPPRRLAHPGDMPAVPADPAPRVTR